MSTNKDMGMGIPCYCGGGMMILYCAGNFAKYRGRYYYKCPNNYKHPKSFIWFDELDNATHPKNDQTSTPQFSSSSRAPTTPSYSFNNDHAHDKSECSQRSIVTSKVDKQMDHIVTTEVQKRVYPSSDSVIFGVSMGIMMCFLAIALVMLDFLIGKNV